MKKTILKQSNKKKEKVGRLQKRESIAGHIFIAAPIIQIILFVLFALIVSLKSSFTDSSLLRESNFIGIDNYKEMFADEKFWKSVFNTVFLMIGIPIGMFISFLLAAALNRGLRATKIFRTIYYLPVISSAVAVAILWKWIFNYDYGVMNIMLSKIGFAKINWLGDEAFIKPALIIIGVWKGIGVNMILFLAGLQSVPKSYYEAADIDGTSGIKKLFKITLPMVTPISFYILIISIIGSFQAFSETYIIANDGGPGYSAATIVYYLWEKGFTNYQMGYASAVAWVLGLIIFIVTIIQFKFSDKWVYNAD